MESEHLATNEKVAGSSPAVFTIKFQILDFNCLPPTANFLRGRPTGRTPDFGSGNTGSNPFPEAKIEIANSKFQISNQDLSNS